jgi:hypothetical protein
VQVRDGVGEARVALHGALREVVLDPTDVLGQRQVLGAPR